MGNQQQERCAEQFIPLDVTSLVKLRETYGAASIHIPEAWYDVQRYNDVSLMIHEALLHQHRVLQAHLVDRGSSVYRNVLMLLFHELQSQLSQSAFAAMEQSDCSANRAVRYMYQGSVVADTSEMFDHISTARTGQECFVARRYVVRAARIVANALRSMCVASNMSRVAALENVACDHAVLRVALQRLGCSLSVQHAAAAPGVKKLYLEEYSWQENFLLQTLDCLCLQLQEEYHIALDVEGVQRYGLWLLGEHCTDVAGPSLTQRMDLLVTGSQCPMRMRAYAAEAKSQGVPVVMMWHGGSFGAFDEPVFSYGELAYCDAVVGFGQSQLYAQKANCFPRLYDNPVRYAYATNPQVRSVYRSETTIPRIADLTDPRVMYVPTSFSGMRRYGPFRDLPDVAYAQWQDNVLSYLWEVFPGRVVWKQHRKEKFAKSLTSSAPVDVENEKDFSELLDSADVFVFDYVSTALTVAAATQKPIIYLDIGLRHLTPEARMALEERCLWVCQQPPEIDVLRAQWDVLRRQRCVDAYSPAFSVGERERSVEAVLASTCQQMLASGATRW